MFVFKTLGRLVWSNPTNPELVQIFEGQLFMVERPHGGKERRILLFKDANLTVRRTSEPFHFQLVVTRIYEEGEDIDLDADDSDEERSFLLDSSLRPRMVHCEGVSLLRWRDLEHQGDSSDWFYEFLADPSSTTAYTISMFERTVRECMWERAHKRSHFDASDDQIDALKFTTDLPEEHPSSLGSPSDPSSPLSSSIPTSTSSLPKGPIIGDVAGLELSLFDPTIGRYDVKGPSVHAVIHETGPYQYTFRIVNHPDDPHALVEQPIVPAMTPTFSPSLHSFTWCYTDPDSAPGLILTWKLRFPVPAEESRFQTLFCRCAYESLNHSPFSKTPLADQEYLIRAYDIDEDIVMSEADAQEFYSASESEGEDEDEAPADREDTPSYGRSAAEHHEESDDDDANGGERFRQSVRGGASNSLLTVGHKHERSFVVRGDKIGVFSNGPRTSAGGLAHAATINAVSDLQGNPLSPQCAMLHDADTSLILLDSAHDESKAYRMDLNYGKVVEEWSMGEGTLIANVAPDSKFAQLSGEPTLVGLSPSSLYRIDPRLSGSKRVSSETKQYASRAKTDFSCATTSEKGWLAVGSAKGEVRLYDRIGISAKSLLPALGDPILGIDVSADGRWVIATCQTYLLLIDTSNPADGLASSGFTKPFPKDMKPKPQRLQLRQEDLAYMGDSLHFTPARFNTGLGEEEKRIVTSTGPYVITWNFRRVKAGKVYDYQILRYTDTVVADNFRFGEDRNIIVALPDDVTSANTSSLQLPQHLLKAPPKTIRSRANLLRARNQR